MRTKKFETRLQLNSYFENYDIDFKNIFENKNYLCVDHDEEREDECPGPRNQQVQSLQSQEHVQQGHAQQADQPDAQAGNIKKNIFK